MNPNKLSRLFPHASKSFLKLNSDRIDDPRVSGVPEQVAGKSLGDSNGEEAVEPQYRLRRVEIEFFANHGKVFDEDNRRYIAKIINDSLVQLSFSSDDKDITTETTQRLHKD